MSKISSLRSREILDSRGNPTVEVTCELESGSVGKSSIPSGASTGVHEACELRDGDKKRYNGLGVLKAVSNINEEINKFIKGKEFDQRALDRNLIELDGEKNKSRLGANAILGVSLSFAEAVSKEKGLELYEYLGDLAKNKKYVLPLPMLNIINGGLHADSGLDIQEFMIGPVGFDSFKRKIQAGAEVVVSLKKRLKSKGYSTNVGDEGGFAPKLKENEEAFELISQAVIEAGYSTDEIKMGIDAAASNFYHEGKYNLKISGEEKVIQSEELIEWYEELSTKYPIISIEDGLSEDDWQGFSNMVLKLGDKLQIVGDDLTVTNIERIKIASEKKAVNSVLIKLNQIGTLSETIEAINLTKENGWKPFVSHRSGETTNTFIADLSVGLSCDYIKSGSLSRGERICKYNRLMEIEDKLLKNS